MAAFAAGSLLLASAGVAYADTVSNNLDLSVDAVAEIMPLNAGGAHGTTTLAVTPTNSDGKNGCNLTGSTTLTLGFVSSNPGVATVSPSSATFTSCGATQALTLTPVAVGSASVTARILGNNTGGSFDLAPAAFTVNVSAPAPSNTAPQLTVSGVTTGASYAKGSVPAAICNVTDAEDGPSSFAATLGAITGADAATGIGSQEASCFYTDGGGLTAASSVTYSIVDATAPQVSYTLNPVAADGFDGWYRSNVALTWSVTESDSPSTLQLNGCQDQVIALDQLPADYSCTATSSGGTTGPVTVPIKKDGTAPSVSYTSATGSGGNDGWYTSDVLALFTAADATSGPASATQTVASAGEGSAVTVFSPEFLDNAGNATAAGAASHSFKIDKTAPAVSYTGASGTEGTNGWYRSDVVATFTGTDETSGPLSATKTVTSNGEGSSVVVESPAFEDVAGNVTDAGAATSSYEIDKTAPTVAFSTTVPTGYFGSTPAAPDCVGSDALSGLASCVVSGYGTEVGSHTLTATATDNAGNTATATQTYSVLAWTIRGFYQPVDMDGVLNTVKGGSTVPAKFEVFAGSTELTDPSLVSLSASRIQCTLDYIDAIEATTTGNTSLRYDATAGQFIYKENPHRCGDLLQAHHDRKGWQLHQCELQAEVVPVPPRRGPAAWPGPFVLQRRRVQAEMGSVQK
jgi:hypothetical protein